MNGFFFNFNDISVEIIEEIEKYLNNIETTSEEQINANGHIADNNESGRCETVHPAMIASTENAVLDSSLTKKVSLSDECENIVKCVSTNDMYINTALILSHIEKEKTAIYKKTAINKFSIAKKKYGKPILIENKNLIKTSLFYDYT
jgi:hypothetical protein